MDKILCWTLRYMNLRIIPFFDSTPAEIFVSFSIDCDIASSI